jgi:hypothetical protein
LKVLNSKGLGFRIQFITLETIVENV